MTTSDHSGRSLVARSTRWPAVAFLFLGLLLNPAGARAQCPAHPECVPNLTFYVRACSTGECRDQNDGTSPLTAWRTLRRAARYVNSPAGNPGTCVIVGPGTYPEGDIDLQRNGSFNARGVSLPIQFIADQSGVCTSDAPGPVVLEVPASVDTGFLIFGASDVVVSGFEIRGATVAGVQVKVGSFGQVSQRAVIANNVIHDGRCRDVGTGCRGIDVVDADETLVFNNLIYRNTQTGISVRSETRGSSAPRIINNTIYGHEQGIVVGSGPVPEAPGAWVINNIVAASGRFGIDLSTSSRCDYIGAFNLVTGGDGGGGPQRYSPSTPRDPSDLAADPAFNAPAIGDFTLSARSPAIDAGSADSVILGLEATSARTDGALDEDLVDIGFHWGSTSYPDLTAVPIELQTVFVRSDGNDEADGTSRQRAVLSIQRAVELARAVSRVVVGPGTYDGPIVLNTELPSPAGPIEFFADASGEITGDSPGRVIVNGHGLDDTFNIIAHCSTVIDGFVVINGNDNGIGIKQSHRSIVRNNIAVSNVRRGINVVSSDDVQVSNNLAYANGAGIQTGGDPGSRNTIIESNTAYGNDNNGILVGTNNVPSPGAMVRYNVVANNGKVGLQLDSNETGGLSAEGFCALYNFVFHAIPAQRYGPIQNVNCATCLTPVDDDGPCADPMCVPKAEGGCELAPVADRTLDPTISLPPGRDGCMGGRRARDDDFRLAPGSTAVNFSDTDPVSAGLAARTTQTDDSPDDDDTLDAGFHYLPGSFTDLPPLASDCNVDSCVTVDELLHGISIALAMEPLRTCEAADADGDGEVAVYELVTAVSDAFCCMQKARQR